jgi:SAM-dependent methyltransferase
MINHFIKHKGYCQLCEKKVRFISKHSWLRDHFICPSCKSIPRERALFKVILDFFPHYRNLYIHESSPADRGTSLKLKRESRNYSSSQYFPDVPKGSRHSINGVRCEDLEDLSFPDNSFDIFITQDVMEHIFNPEMAFKEIERVLKQGGAHIFTVPLVNKAKKSQRRAARDENGEVKYLFEPEYHGNPADPKGALVTMYWGYDIASYITKKTNMLTIIVMMDNIDLGIRAEYIDVLISWKI